MLFSTVPSVPRKTYHQKCHQLYLSISQPPQPPPPVCQLGPAEPPSPSGHTSLLLTPMTTCPSLALRRSIPESQQSGLQPPYSMSGNGHADMCLKYRPRKALVWVFLVPNHKCASGPWPPFGLSSLLLSSTGLSSEYSTSHVPSPLGGAPTLKYLTNGSSWSDMG